MAVFTPLSLDDAQRVAAAHGVACDSVVPIARGSVNSNFALVADERSFLRIYEDQDRDGVAYEWALLDHLHAAGLPVPRRRGDVEPGEVRVAGKCTAVFEWVGGEMSCQKAVSATRMETLGSLVGRAHREGANFGWRRAGRFQRSDIRRRLDEIPADATLTPIVHRLRNTDAELETRWPVNLPVGVAHGDLFRDNVHWQDDVLVAAIDWESASDYPWAYDLCVTLLAWSMGDDLDWGLAAALVRGYQSERVLEPAEWEALHVFCRAAALRFTVTRITDFHLREDDSGVHKSYERFLARLDAIESISPAELTKRLAV